MYDPQEILIDLCSLDSPDEANAVTLRNMTTQRLRNAVHADKHGQIRKFLIEQLLPEKERIEASQEGYGIWEMNCFSTVWIFPKARHISDRRFVALAQRDKEAVVSLHKIFQDAMRYCDLLWREGTYMDEGTSVQYEDDFVGVKILRSFSEIEMIGWDGLPRFAPPKQRYRWTYDPIYPNGPATIETIDVS